MSIQNAKALYTRLLSDKEFRSKLERTTSYLQRVQILQSAGFSCTPTELNIAKNEMLQFNKGNRDLSDVEQQHIVGGSSLKSLLDRFDHYLLKEK